MHNHKEHHSQKFLHYLICNVPINGNGGIKQLCVGKDTPKGEHSPEYRGANPEVEKAKYGEKVKELQALELTTKNYQAMKALVQYFGLETENLKAESLIGNLQTKTI